MCPFKISVNVAPSRTSYVGSIIRWPPFSSNPNQAQTAIKFRFFEGMIG